MANGDMQQTFGVGLTAAGTVQDSHLIPCRVTATQLLRERRLYDSGATNTAAKVRNIFEKNVKQMRSF